MGERDGRVGRDGHGRPMGGVVHSYQRYDPQRFPPPTEPGPDVAGAAMRHLMRYGERRALTEEELRNAIRLDPSQIAGLGPSLDALIEMLEERKRKILETYETKGAERAAERAFREGAGALRPPGKMRAEVEGALRRGQIVELENLWYAAERLDGAFARALLGVIDRLGARYEVEELGAKYPFTGREALTVEEALEVKAALETIDKLLEQLRQAKKDARVALIDLEVLKQFVDEADAEGLREMGRQIEEMIRRQAELQGLERDGAGHYRLTPRAMKVFQTRLLREIFSELEAARSGRHTGPIVGDGVVELPRTRGYEFGDAASQIDLPQTLVNAAVRGAVRGGGLGGGAGVRGEDIEVHLTRNSPKCATCLLIDMSGSMGQMGQYMQCKRMALAMDGLIRREYPGDFLRTIEVATFARTVSPGEIVGLMPKPVTTREPVVQLRVDMSDPGVTASMVHPHFTNIQHGLRLARRHLAGAETPNKQVILFTDGLPTAHFENGPGTGVKGGSEGHLYLLYPPHPLTERATMREAAACAREGITINIFLLPSWSQDEDDVAFAHRLAQETGGRVVFVAGQELDRMVLWDYVSGRRKIIG